jgi:phage repressor protein C with HTH and peptisase S24 domain
MFANTHAMEGLEADRELIQSLVKWTRLSPSAVAKQIGSPPSTITRHHNGLATARLSQPIREKLKKRWPDFPGFLNQTSDHVSRVGERADPAERKDELVYIRQVDITYAMGDGAVIDDYPEGGLVPFNLGFIQAISRAPTDRLFIANGHGDSMEPTLLRSDLIMIDASQNRVAQQDQIWALNYAGAGMIKRLRRVKGTEGDELLIMSDNPTVTAQSARLEDVHIVGKVVWVGRRM